MYIYIYENCNIFHSIIHENPLISYIYVGGYLLDIRDLYGAEHRILYPNAISRATLGNDCTNLYARQ